MQNTVRTLKKKAEYRRIQICSDCIRRSSINMHMVSMRVCAFQTVLPTSLQGIPHGGGPKSAKSTFEKKVAVVAGFRPPSGDTAAPTPSDRMKWVAAFCVLESSFLAASNSSTNSKSSLHKQPLLRRSEVQLEAAAADLGMLSHLEERPFSTKTFGRYREFWGKKKKKWRRLRTKGLFFPNYTKVLLEKKIRK